MKEAMFYEKKGESVRCLLCPRFCTIPEGSTGFCRARKNVKGKLQSLVYGRLAAMHIDPIEKKPLFHFAPGTQCLSISTVGCNLDCSFCQNWEISHPDSISGDEASPKEVVKMATDNGVPGIAYTYTEPTVFFEYALDTMKLAKAAGLYNVWVSNGYINPEPAKAAAACIDAINVDLKGDTKFYQKLCSVPDEGPMHEALKVFKDKNVWIEITNLIIPGFNDRPEQTKKLLEWIKENLGLGTPVHFSRFFPHFKMKDTPPTPKQTLEKAAGIADKMGFRYVYVGNIDAGRESTLCPKCRTVVIARTGYATKYNGDTCPKCGEKIEISGKKWVAGK